MRARALTLGLRVVGRDGLGLALPVPDPLPVIEPSGEPLTEGSSAQLTG